MRTLENFYGQDGRNYKKKKNMDLVSTKNLKVASKGSVTCTSRKNLAVKCDKSQ